MEENLSIDALIFDGSEIERSDYVGYPIFTLRTKSDSVLIDDWRELLKEMGLSHREILMPGLQEEETGFVVPLPLTNKISDYMHENDIYTDLATQLNAWGDSVNAAKLPPGVEIPPECFNNITEGLQVLAECKEFSKSPPSKFIVLHVPTGEQANVVVDFINRKYTTDKPLEGWVHTALISI